MPGASTARESASDINLYRVPGEDTPFWVAVGFSALGPPMALAAAYLLASPDALALRSASAPAPIAHVLRAPVQPLVRPTRMPLEQAPPAAKEGAGEPSSAQLPRREATCLPAMSIAFSHNSSQPMLDGAEAQLEPLLKWLKDHRDATLLVEGHADPKGSEGYNVMLSYSRAQAVIAWLVELGIEKRRMTSLAAGAALPKNPALVVADNRMALVQVAGVANCQAESLQRQ